MPIIARGGGGGGGLHFRNPVDVFGTNALRNAHFTTTDPAAYLDFVRDRSLAIVIGTLIAPTDFQTYTGDVGTYDNANWVSRVDAVQGFRGDQGRFYIIIHTNSAAQPTPATPTGGTFNLGTGLLTPPTGTTEDPTPPGTGEDVWASQAEIDPKIQSGSVVPVWSEWVERSHLSSGISHVEHTDDFTGLGTAADELGAGVTLARMLDLGDSPVQTGAMFAYVAPTAGYTAGGFLTTGQFVQFEVGIVDSPDDSDVIIRVGTDDYTLVALGGLAVKLFEIVDDTKYLAFGKDDVLLLLGPTDGSGRVVDITESGLPPADADAIGKIFTNRLLPAAWMVHEVPHATTPVVGSFNDYVSARDTHDNFDLFQGSMAADFFTLRVGVSDQTLDSRHVGLFYWNWRDHVFREWVSTFNQQTSAFDYHWQSAHNPGVLLGGTTGVYLGYDTLDSDLLRRMPQDQIDATRRYIGVATHGTGSDEFREFENSSYVAAVAPFNVYDFVTIGLYGAGGNAGQTLGQVTSTIEAFLNTLIGTIDGAGLTNSGTALAPILDVDPSQADFPTIPVARGGTGEIDVAGARSAFGITVLADILTAIMAGTNVTIDRTTTGQITVASSGGGSSFHFTSGAPASSVGDDGDTALDITNGVFYEKVAGTWTSRYTDQIGQAGTMDGVINALSLTINGSDITATAGRSEGVDVVSVALTLPFLLLAGGTLTGALSGITPTDDAHLTRKDYVDTEDALALKIAQNLADLANVATARTNLGLGAVALLASIGVSDLPSAVQNAVRSFSYSTANPQRLSYTEVDGGTSQITLSGLAALAGAVFTGAVSGISPTLAAHLTRKDYVDSEDNLRALLSGAGFTGVVTGQTPTADNEFATKGYVDGEVSGMPSQAEQIYYGVIGSVAEASSVLLTELEEEDATVAGHVITIGPTTASGQYFVILAPADHDILSLINLGTQADALGAYEKDTGVRTENGESYDAYTLGPLNNGVSITYRVTLME